ncbi:hypothetical protein ACSTS3_15045 [Aquimarina muelleri]|uniref:hypothetical protein n=1 Tax=Aquimarina muelleri TaxID=279356 RepID=UPI003F684111
MIENSDLDKQRNVFLLAIVESVQMEIDEFLNRVAHHECYESMIYRWAIRLFYKGISVADAIHIIHRTRLFVLVNRNYLYNQKPIIPFEKILDTLENHKIYKQLSEDEKMVQQRKIEALFNKNAPSEMIEQMLENMSPKLSKKKTDKTCIKQMISQWDLSQYIKKQKYPKR